MARYPFKPDYRVPPGETLCETMQYLGIDLLTLAEQTNILPDTLQHIIDGTQRILPTFANRLDAATGIPASMWLNLEANYRKPVNNAESEAGSS